ncbi:MAG: PAS domain-containing protein [Verrucomicrobiales bacterium]|nr:PAS domain-containing protein [Verrucomicrobiales bacterium]
MRETDWKHRAGTNAALAAGEGGRSFSWASHLVVGSVVALGLILTGTMFEVTRLAAQRGLRRAFAQPAMERIRQIEFAFERHLADLNALKRFFIASAEVTETDFAGFAGPVAGVSGVQAFGWIPRVPAAARPGYESARRATGGTGFVITELAGRPNLVPAGAREEYFPVEFAVPSGVNLGVIGVDVAAELLMRQAMDVARDTGLASATARGVLGWLPDRSEGIVVFQPVYASGKSVTTVEDRRNALRGFAASAIHLASLVRQTVPESEVPEIAIQLVDDSPGATGEVLYSNLRPGAAVSEDPRFLRTSPIAFAGRQWRVVARTSAAFHENRRSLAHYWILPVGVILSLLAGRQTRNLKLQRRQSERLIAEQEGVRRVANEQVALCVRGADLGTWDWDVVTGRTSYNARWAEMLGYQLKDIPQTVATWEQWIHPDDQARVLRTLREHLEGRTGFYETEHRLRHKSGSWIWVLDRGAVMERATDGKALRMCGTHLDVTARKQAEEAVARAISASGRLREAMVAVHRCQTLEEAFGVLLDEAMHLTGLSAGGLYRIEGDELVLSEHRGIDERFAKAVERRAREVEYVRMVLEAPGRVIDLASCFPEFHEFGATFGLRHAYSVVLKAGNTLLGTLNLASREVEPPSAVELQNLSILVAEIDPLLQRLRAQSDLRESQQRLDLALSAAKMGVWEWEVDSRRLHWSRECQNLAGFTDLPATLDSFKERIHHEDLPVFEGAVERALAERAPFDIEFRIQRAGEAIRWLTTVGRAVHDPEGRPTRLVGTLQEVTTRKRIEEHLRHAQKLEGIGKMAGGLAHEFNNILAAILLNQSFIQQNPSDPESQESIRETIVLTRRAAALVRQLIAFSSRSVLEVRRFELHPVLEELCRLLEVQVGERIRLEYRTDCPSVAVEADQGMIEQVVVNLCMNARDAMPDGGTLRIHLEERVLTPEETLERPAARVGHFACLSIEDTGRGIDAATLERLFEPFFTTKPVGAGSGMGLATVYGILQQHRGWVEVVSELHQGSVFRVFLPVAAPAPAVANPKTNVRPQRLESPTILLAEDEAAVRRATGLLLRGWGYEVEEASNGEEAVRRFEEDPDRFHLLLSDMVMPGRLSGLELALALTAIRSSLKVILISGIPMDLSREGGSKPHDLLILSKPCPPGELRAHIEACIGEGNRGRQRPAAPRDETVAGER